MDIKDNKAANFALVHAKGEEVTSVLNSHEGLMRGLTKDVKNHQREIKTVKTRVSNIEKKIKENEKKFEGNVRNAMASEMRVLADRVEAVAKRTSRPGAIGTTIPPPTSAASSSSSQIGPAGCELVTGLFAG